MRKMFVVTVFMLATLAWAAAQQPGGMPERSGGQATSPSSQIPDARPSTPGTADQAAPQTGAQPGSQGQAASAPQITEGCLGGSNPNFTITDQAGTTYKLNLPANADASTLGPHVGESVQVMGEVKAAGRPASTPASIDVSRIGRGTGTCPSSSPRSAPPPPKQ